MFLEYVIPAVIMLFLDVLYLTNIGGRMFGNMVKNIQGHEIKLNIYGAIGAYTLMLVALYKFILVDRKSPTDAFILGLCIYGVFDFTNYTIFKKYDMFVGGLDILWGGVLYYVVTWLTYKTYKILGIRH